MCSGCDSVGRAVASDSRGAWFKSSHQQKFILNIYCQLYWKDENKEKEAGNGPFLKKNRQMVDGFYKRPNNSNIPNYTYKNIQQTWGSSWDKYLLGSVTRLGDLLDLGQLLKAFGNN